MLGSQILSIEQLTVTVLSEPELLLPPGCSPGSSPPGCSGSVAGTLVGGLLINQGGIRMMLWGGVFFAVAGTVITLYARIRERKQ